MREPLGNSEQPQVEVATGLDGPRSAQSTTRRAHRRNEVGACRPINIQLLDQTGAVLSGWHQADILDLSLGGLCLLLTEDLPVELSRTMRLQIDVRSHPGFGADALTGELRWFVRSGLILSLGVGFDHPLTELPELLPCRRAQRRPLDLDQTLD